MASTMTRIETAQARATCHLAGRAASRSHAALGLEGGASVVAIVTNESARNLALAEGVPAAALFKASSVIVGVAG